MEKITTGKKENKKQFGRVSPVRHERKPQIGLHAPPLLAKAGLVFFLFLFSVLLLFGCVNRNPNSNLASGTCCNLSTDPNAYTCTAAKPDKNGVSALSACGACRFLDTQNGKLYGSGYDGSDRNSLGGELMRGSLPYSMSDCEHNCNFQAADCTNSDSQNTCYGFDKNGQPDKAVRVAPICANTTPDPCVQNNCTVLMCGKKAPAPKLTIDENGISAVTDRGSEGKGQSNLFSDMALNNPQSGLVGQVCEIDPLDAKAGKQLKSGKWTVASFRLGVQGSFSDYDRARFYFPPTDAFCRSPSSKALVDRYTSYLDGTNPLPEFRTGTPVKCTKSTYGHCAPQNTNKKCAQNADCSPPDTDCVNILDHYNCPLTGSDYGTQASCDAACIRTTIDYKAPLSLCKLDPDKDPYSYYCAKDPNLKFSFTPNAVAQQLAYEACQKSCDYASLKSCNSYITLNTITRDAGAPYSGFGSEDNYHYWQEGINRSEYMKRLAAAYPTPASSSGPDDPNDPRNYYKPLLTDQQLMGADPQTVLNYFSTPGPAGAKAFECLSGNDCMSGQCTQNGYSRTSCYDDKGASIDCQCQYVKGCAQFFNCNQYVKDSVQLARCTTEKAFCEAAGGNDKPVLLCRYPSDTETRNVSVEATSTAGTNSCVDQWKKTGHHNNGACDGVWGVLDFEEFNKYFIGDRSAFDPSNPNRWDYLDANHNGMKGPPYNLELANIQRRVTLKDKCVKDDNTAYVDPALSCTGDYRLDGSQCCHYVDDGIGGAVYVCDGPVTKTCSAPYQGPKDLLAWKDDTAGYQDLRWTWRGSYSPVPSWQPISKNSWFITHRDITKDNLAERFPLIKQCQMTIGDYGDDKADVWEEKPNLTNVAPGSLIGVDEQNNMRYDKTWVVKSFGKCQVESNNHMPIVNSYGVCEPCGSVLSMAYQKVTDWPPVQPDGGYDANKLDRHYGYCPSGCKEDRRGNIMLQNNMVYCYECSKDYPAPGFSAYSEGTPSSQPEYGYIVNKVDEYQSSGIMPVLDMRDYAWRNNFNVSKMETRKVKASDVAWSGTTAESFCKMVGGTLDHASKKCEKKDQRGYCLQFSYDCVFGPQNDWLLSFLAKNHSAAVVEVADLPPTCSQGQCASAQERLLSARAICPDCLLALEYDSTLRVSQPAYQCGNLQVSYADAELQYSSQGLKGAIESWSGGAAKYDAENFKPNPLFKKLPNMSNVNVLVLQIDLSQPLPPGADLGDPANAAKLENAINQSINLSRHVLQQANWPTVWKLTYSQSCPAPMVPGLYNDPKFFEALYAHQRELTLAGVAGILLPPVDNKSLQSNEQPKDTDAYLLPAKDDGSGTLKRAKVTDTNTPFCAASQASADYLHPEIMGAVRKVYAQNFSMPNDKTAMAMCDGGNRKSGACVPCSDAEMALGICDPLCQDGSMCSQQGKAPGATNYKCKSDCVSLKYCMANECAGSSTITCTAARSTNKPPVRCCDATRTPPETPSATDPCVPKGVAPCDVQVLTQGQLANDILLPEAPQLIGGLPAGQVCCLKDSTNIKPGGVPIYYTYRARASIQLSAEPVIFPAGGSDTANCGRESAAGKDDTIIACGGTKPVPQPLGTVYWTCAKNQ